MFIFYIEPVHVAQLALAECRALGRRTSVWCAFDSNVVYVCTWLLALAPPMQCCANSLKLRRVIDGGLTCVLALL